jgi:hypothetical protein
MEQPTKTNHRATMTKHGNNKQQTMMTMQQSTWTSVLCSNGRQENKVEMLDGKA